MNLIPKICELLGVEIGEEFGVQEVENCDTEMFRYKYRFTQTELQFKTYDYWIPTTIPTSLLTGQAEIKKLPFEPKEGEQYWFIGLYDEKPTVMHTIWNSADMTHYERKYSGNVFRGFDDSHKMQYEIYEKLTGRKWEEKDG